MRRAGSSGGVLPTCGARRLLGRGRSLGLALVVGAMLTAACASPEATRTRQGGPGGDIGNRGAQVEIHGRTDPAYDVPLVGQGVEKAGEGAPAGQGLRSERNAGR